MTCRMDAVQRECGVRVKEYAELVDIKTARIKVITLLIRHMGGQSD